MRMALLAASASVLLGAAPLLGAIVIIDTNSDTAVDRNNPATVLDLNNIQVQTAGSGSSNPRLFAFLQFPLGSTAASSVTLSGKTVNTANGTRVAGGHIFAKVHSFDDTTFNYNASFLSSMPGATVTFADVSSYIAGQGWTQLDAGDTTNVLFQLARGTQNTVYDTSGLPNLQSDLLNFYNSHLGQTISFLFVSSQPLNGNTPTWFNTENAADTVNKQVFKLTVNEVPEPAALAMLGVGAMFVRRRRH